MKKLFYNGKIITMVNNKVKNNVLIANDKIIGIDVLENKIDKYLKINLNGKTLLPAFIDSHSHLSSLASSFLQIDLSNATSFNDIINLIKDYKISNSLNDSDWLVGISFDINKLSEKEIPTKDILDVISNPIVISHISGHYGVFNTKAMISLNINSDTGILKEEDYFKNIKQIPLPITSLILSAYQKAQYEYVKNGIVVVQDFYFVKEMIPLYKSIITNNILYLDVVIYPEVSIYNEIVDTFKKTKVKIGGIKVILDGSLLTNTALVSSNYKNTLDFGKLLVSKEFLVNAIKKALNENIQLIVHTSGDEAIKVFLDLLETFPKEEIKKQRFVLIHAHLLTKKELKRVKELSLIVSFFIGHIYHFGDFHIKNLGFYRASNLCIANSTLHKKIIFTIHQDTPVIKPNMLESIWTSVVRKTKNNIVLGENEQIEVIDSLKAVTINAAYQLQEEKRIGSIEIGKQADFVILDENPLEVSKNSIKDIKVLETIKDGFTIYIKVRYKVKIN